MYNQITNSERLHYVFHDSEHNVLGFSYYKTKLVCVEFFRECPQITPFPHFALINPRPSFSLQTALLPPIPPKCFTKANNRLDIQFDINILVQLTLSSTTIHMSQYDIFSRWSLINIQQEWESGVPVSVSSWRYLLVLGLYWFLILVFTGGSTCLGDFKQPLFPFFTFSSLFVVVAEFRHKLPLLAYSICSLFSAY